MVARLFFNCYIFNYYRNERLKKEKSVFLCIPI